MSTISQVYHQCLCKRNQNATLRFQESNEKCVVFCFCPLIDTQALFLYSNKKKEIYWDLIFSFASRRSINFDSFELAQMEAYGFCVFRNFEHAQKPYCFRLKSIEIVC